MTLIAYNFTNSDVVCGNTITQPGSGVDAATFPAVAKEVLEANHIYIRKLETVANAAEDFINSDGDYFAWTEDERHCMSRLRDAILALKEQERE